MATHEIPRNVKGEGRILMIFSAKSLIYTTITGAFGLIFYYIFASVLGWTWLGIGLAVFFALIGFAIATFKIPETNSFEITRKTGGEKIDEVILRAIKFKAKGKRLYLYTKEEIK